MVAVVAVKRSRRARTPRSWRRLFARGDFTYQQALTRLATTTRQLKANFEPSETILCGVAEMLIAKACGIAVAVAWMRGRKRRRSRFPRLPTDGVLLGFLTDIEGNMAYLERYVDISKVLRWGECEAGRRRLELIDPTRHYFVHGGDLFDKGPHDERLSALLVDLKRRHPDRVVLLMGNRDINKLRLAAELGPDDLARDVATLDAGLVPGVGGRTFAAYLREHGLEGDAHAAHDAAPVNFLQNTISDRTHCIAQLRLGSSFLLSVPGFLTGVV